MKDHAFTGLEAALVLIAFIIVASVFSYTILNTGFMITQKSRNVVYTAVGQTTSTLEIAGHVIGAGEPGITTEIYAINFSCSIAPPGTAVDFEKLVLTFSNATLLETLERDPATYNPAGCTRGSGTWAVFQKNPDEGSDNVLLEPGEQFVISACPSRPVIAGDTFTLEIKPDIGVALSLTRTVPGVVRPVNSLQ